MKIKIGKEAASFALKEQQKELNYDDQSQNRGKESEVFQNVLEGSRSKLGAIRKSFKRQKEQRNEFMKIWQQANPVMPKIPSDKVAKYNYKIDNIVTKPKVVVAQVRELCVRLGTVTEDAHKNEMGIAKPLVGREIPGEGQAAQTSQNTPVVWKPKTERRFSQC